MLSYSTVALGHASADVIAAWNAIVAAARLNPSLAPGWLRVAVDTLADETRPLALQIGAAADRRVAAIMPFYRSAVTMLGIPMRQLELGSNLSSYHAELVAPGRCAEALDALLAREKWDVLRASNVPVSSETAAAIELVAQRRGSHVQTLAGERSPYLAIGGTWQEYLATKDKKFRYKWRKRREAVESSKELRLEWRTRADEVAGLLSDILKIEKSSWKAAAGSTIAAREYEMRYQRALLPYLAAQGLLRANVLYQDAKPIAYSVCCHCLGWVGHLKTSFDEAYKELSPGAFVIDASVEWAFEANATEFDFLGDAAQHKLAWTPTVREHKDYFVFARGLKPRLVVALKNLARRARPPSDSGTGHSGQSRSTDSQ